MSLFTLFTTTGTPVPHRDTVKVIHDVVNRDLPAVRAYEGSHRDVRDTNRQTLLHYATMAEDREMVKYLLEQQCDPNVADRFKLSPWDYAIRSHNKDLIATFTGHDARKIGTLCEQNTRLQTRNTDLETLNQRVTAETVILKKNNKRLREENDHLQTRVGTLSLENEELVRVNKKLKTSVDSLTQALRK